MSTIRKTYTSDIPEALKLAEGLVGLFPGMDIPEFESSLRAAIERGEAITAERHDCGFGGLIIISAAEREIAFLAVDPKTQGVGLGSLLMERAIQQLGEGEISVTTFMDGVPEGAAARALYKKFGFEDAEQPEILGVTLQRMVRR